MRQAFIAVCILALTLFAATAAQATPPLINYQGVLTDAAGDAVPDDSYSITFTIYDAASGGASVWTETQDVSTVDGSFAVLLGSVSPILDIVFDGTTRYLGVAVEADPEMAPLTPLVTVPFAFRAAKAVFSDSTEAITDGAVDFADIGQNGAILGQVLKWSGSAWEAGEDIEGVGAESDPEVGVNATNFLPKWDGLALVAGTIYDNGNIGIGTSGPATKLDVDGAIAISGSVVINSSGAWVGDPTGLIGPAPDHQWSGTSLRFQNSDGSWGAYVDLEGVQGPQGVQGVAGPTGATGAQGNQGIQGPAGPTVTSVAVCTELNCNCGGWTTVTNQNAPCFVTSDTGSCSRNSTGNCCICAQS